MSRISLLLTFGPVWSRSQSIASPCTYLSTISGHRQMANMVTIAIKYFWLLFSLRTSSSASYRSQLADPSPWALQCCWLPLKFTFSERTLNGSCWVKLCLSLCHPLRYIHIYTHIAKYYRHFPIRLVCLTTLYQTLVTPQYNWLATNL